MIEWKEIYSYDHPAPVLLQKNQIVYQSVNLVRNTSAEYDAAMSQRNRDTGFLLLWSGIGLAGTVGLVWSFTF